MAKCVLLHNQNAQIELLLSDNFRATMKSSLLDAPLVFEDGSYGIEFECEQYERSLVEKITVCVNGECIGTVSIGEDFDHIKGVVEYDQHIFANQPFLLHYDFVFISFAISFIDGSFHEYFSNLLLCVSKREEDNSNIKDMLQALMSFDNTQFNDWIFSSLKDNQKNSFHEGKWKRRTYRSLNSYVQLLDEIAICYQNNFAFFKMRSKHTLRSSAELLSYRKVKKLSRENIQWLMHNMSQLSNISERSGIQYRGKNYLPHRLKTDIARRTSDVYENKILLGFLYTVLSNAEQIETEFARDILNEERIVKQANRGLPKEYSAPIITVKFLQVSFGKILLQSLRRAIKKLRFLQIQYQSFLAIKTDVLTTLPKKTRSFSEIKPYAQIFGMILKWFQYGECSLEKEQLLLQVKTLDQLFEYYCLWRILELLFDHGYRQANTENSMIRYQYTSADDRYQNETDIPNTYLLKKGDITVTVYYQPVISSFCMENDLTIFRTTNGKTRESGYYTPDFVLKFSTQNFTDEYVIFDAKFSSRQNIKKYALPEVVRKYSCELSTVGLSAPKMVWVLQGRVNHNDSSMWRFHDSILSKTYLPATSYGIVSMNTVDNIGKFLWKEISSRVSFLD